MLSAYHWDGFLCPLHETSSVRISKSCKYCVQWRFNPDRRFLFAIKRGFTVHRTTDWGEPERAPHGQSNGDDVCRFVHSFLVRTVTFRIYAYSNLPHL